MTKTEMEQRDEILQMAAQCLRRREGIRPEVKWLAELYDRFRREHGMLSKAEADQLLYQRIIENGMETNYGPTKIRYWRTGRHIPANREQCLAFGASLELTETEMAELLQKYYDRSDTVYEEIPDRENASYWKRRSRMDELQREYLLKARPELFFRDHATWESQKKNFRHLYYMDACRYTVHGNQWFEKDRSVSMSYHSELSRTLQLLGEIPRKTMIRHLIILCMPYLNRDRMDNYLEFFGYLPLMEDHTQTGGEYLDWLLIGILNLYEKYCKGKEPESCTGWFQWCCRILDQFFAEHGMGGMRFMEFKTLKK